MTLEDAFAQLRAANVPVPKPRRLPTVEEVDAAERDLGVRFHTDYRRFQLEASNVHAGLLEPAVVLPEMTKYPYLDLRQTAATARSIGVPHDVVPFCQDNGDYFFIDADGRIGFWDYNGRSAIPLQKSLAEWIVDEWLVDLDEAG